MPPRKKKLKPPNKHVTFGARIEDTVVPDHVVRSWSKLLPVCRKMDKMYGEGQWKDRELRQYIAQREWAKHKAWEKHLAGQQGETRAPVSSSTEERVESIMRQFPDLTKAHLPMVRQLVAFEQGLTTLTEKFEDAVKKPDTDKVRKLQQTMTSLQTEIRQMQRQLRIDVGSLRGEGAEEIRREIITVMDRAKALLQKHAVRLVCPACQKKDIEINLGFLLFHFRDNVPWHLYLVCPHEECGQGIHITGGPDQEEVAIYNGPEHMRPPQR